MMREEGLGAGGIHRWRLDEEEGGVRLCAVRWVREGPCRAESCLRGALHHICPWDCPVGVAPPSVAGDKLSCSPGPLLHDNSKTKGHLAKGGEEELPHLIGGRWGKEFLLKDLPGAMAKIQILSVGLGWGSVSLHL